MDARDIEIRMRRNDDRIPFGILFRESIKLTVGVGDSSESYYQALYESRLRFRELYIIMNTKKVNTKRGMIVYDYARRLHTNDRLVEIFLDAYYHPEDYTHIWANYD